MDIQVQDTFCCVVKGFDLNFLWQQQEWGEGDEKNGPEIWCLYWLWQFFGRRKYKIQPDGTAVSLAIRGRVRYYWCCALTDVAIASLVLCLVP